MFTLSGIISSPFTYICILIVWLIILTRRQPKDFERLSDRVARQSGELNSFRVNLDTFANSMHDLNKLHKELDEDHDALDKAVMDLASQHGATQADLLRLTQTLKPLTGIVIVDPNVEITEETVAIAEHTLEGISFENEEED